MTDAQTYQIFFVDHEAKRMRQSGLIQLSTNPQMTFAQARAELKNVVPQQVKLHHIVAIVARRIADAI